MEQKLKKHSNILGIALLSVMIVIASISATAGWLLHSQYIDIQRTTRLLAKEQAFLFALTLENFARDMLKKEALYTRNREAEVDFYVDELWQGQEWSNTTLLDYKSFGNRSVFANVSNLSIKIYDLQGFFDINNLRRTTNRCNSKEKGFPNNLQPRQVMSRFFDKLLQKHIKFDKFAEGKYKHTHLHNSLRDWLDDNDSELGNGAEDAFYGLSDIPYRSANSYLSTIEELYYINGFRELPTKQFKQLSRYLVALPYAPRPACPLQMNLMTMPTELLALFIKSLHPALNSNASEKAKALKELLCKPPIEKNDKMKVAIQAVLPNGIQDAKAKDEITKWARQLSDRIFSVSSRYFAAQMMFEYAKQPFTMTSIFYVRRGAKAKDKIPPVQLLSRRTSTTFLKGWKFHGTGDDALCPQKRDDENEIT